MFFVQVNGKDVSNSSHEEAVEVFLAAEEPIMVEVKRRGDNSPTGSIKTTDNIRNNFSSNSLSLQNSQQHNSGDANGLPERHSQETVQNTDPTTNLMQNGGHVNCNSETTISPNLPEQDEIRRNSVLRSINESIIIPKECNDFSESTSTLTINPDAAAVSEEFLVPTINYDVSNMIYNSCLP